LPKRIKRQGVKFRFSNKIKKKFSKLLKKCLPSIIHDVIISDVVTLIALKREVAALEAGISVERRSSYENWRQVTVQYNLLHMADKTCEDNHNRIHIRFTV